MKMATNISYKPNREHYTKTLDKVQSLYLVYSYKVVERRLPWEDRLHHRQRRCHKVSLHELSNRLSYMKSIR